MRPMVIASSLVLAAGALSAQPPRLSQGVREFVTVDAPVVALTNVRVIDGTGAPPVAGQTIVISGGKIQAVGSAASVKVPAGARIADLAGHTVIPGLIGLHDHTFYTTAAGRRVQLGVSAPRLYLASGVTTIRTTGSISPYSELNMKAAIEAGEMVGPRMHISGPYITGPDNVIERMHVTTPEDARRVVAYWAEEGATWFKVYTGITRRELGAAIDEAHKRGVKVTGHLCSVGYREAVALGIDALEHGLFANSEYDPEKKPDACPQGGRGRLESLDVNSDAVKATFRDMIAKNVAMTSTLAVYELSLPDRPPLDQRMLDAMLPDARAEYLAARTRVSENAASSRMPVIFRKGMDYEVAFVKAGGLLAAGVDPTGSGGALPGFGDQRNYELLIEAGFTPPQAVQIMSANGAKVLGVDDRLGTVTPGKIADLVVIRGDPAANPADIKNVTVVFKDGIGYDSAKLIASVKGLVGLR